jgi:molybdenum cofactor biosynthesis enzyme MoaA
VLIVLLALVPVGVAAYRGVRMSLDTADAESRIAGARQEARWRCVEREIDAALPAGAKVTVPMDQPLLPYQRALELAAPHAQVVSRAGQADFELRLVKAKRHGKCWNFRVDARRL